MRSTTDQRLVETTSWNPPAIARITTHNRPKGSAILVTSRPSRLLRSGNTEQSPIPVNSAYGHVWHTSVRKPSAIMRYQSVRHGLRELVIRN